MPLVRSMQIAERVSRPSTFFFLAILLLAGCTSLQRCAYEGFGRDEWQKPAEVIQALNLKPGSRVADLGSGSGYFTLRLADAVGPTGKVYAVDIDAGLNEQVAKRARERGYKNIEVILAKVDDPLLPPSGVDMIFTTNVYHHIHDRVSYFARAKKHLKPSGRLAIIDFNSKQWFDAFGGHFTPDSVIKKEMGEAGYKLEREYSFLPRQYFLVFALK